VLGQTLATEAQPAADDLYAAIVQLDLRGARISVAVRLRLPQVNSELPGAEVSDMYRPGVYAHQATARIKADSGMMAAVFVCELRGYPTADPVSAWR